jgi:tetratricopeptide (TPR) repeat protein
LSRFHDLFSLSLSNRINMFVYPCPTYDVDWDNRFGYMLDPARNSIYAIYSHTFISSDAILPIMYTLLRHWGYAPPFIVEGLAGYFDFNVYEMKKIMADGTVPQIQDLLTTSGYYSADPNTAEITAGSFTKYLADSYGPGKVKQWYIQSDDLNILKNLQQIFGQPLDSLQNGWVNYIDTIRFTRGLFDFYAGRAGVLMQVDRQFEYLNEMLSYDQYRVDSVDSWRKLAGLCFQTGQYYRAKEAYEKLIGMDSARAQYFQILGNIDLINGDYESAGARYDEVFKIDPTYATSRLQKAEIKAIEGDTAAAVKMAEDFYGVEKSVAGKISFLLFLGEMKKSPGPWRDSAMAEQYFSDAYYWAQELMSQSSDDPTSRFWAGMALFGLGDLNEALTYLETALFLETRSFYLGDILLTLGKINDLQGNRERALAFYREAINAPISVHNHELCTRYTKQPYTE